MDILGGSCLFFNFCLFGGHVDVDVYVPVLVNVVVKGWHRMSCTFSHYTQSSPVQLDLKNDEPLRTSCLPFPVLGWQVLASTLAFFTQVLNTLNSDSFACPTSTLQMEWSSQLLQGDSEEDMSRHLGEPRNEIKRKIIRVNRTNPKNVTGIWTNKEWGGKMINPDLGS